MNPLKKILPVVYEDEFTIVINKPANMLVVPAPGEKRADAAFLLNEQLRRSKSGGSAYPCHRLDRETSGLVLFARNRKARDMLMEQFRARRVRKQYLAFVQGILREKRGELKTFLKHPWPYERREKGKLAITRFKVIGCGPGFSVLCLEPLTGRTNQIRLQFCGIGHPLLGERRFAAAGHWPVKFKRVALHAAVLAFVPPYRPRMITVTAGLPEDMRSFLMERGVPVPSPGLS